MDTTAARGRAGESDARMRRGGMLKQPLRIETRARAATMFVALTVSTLGLSAASAYVQDVAAATGPCGSLGAQSALRCEYASVGTDSFVVPSGVSQVTFDVYGGQGGGYYNYGSDPTAMGGRGGRATATLAVTAGQVFQVDVAGRGGMGTLPANGQPNRGGGGAGAAGTGGANGDASGGRGGEGGLGFGNYGGGGGGGASDIRRGACAATLGCALTDRIVVAGGGGGSSSSDVDLIASVKPDAIGGAGGGSTGDDGNNGHDGYGPFAGSQGGRGFGGTPYITGVGGSSGAGAGGGTDGAAGSPTFITSTATGGAGGMGGNPAVWSDGISWFGEAGSGGGGGGGGYHGGGGGGGGGGSGVGGSYGGGGSGAGGSGYITYEALSSSMTSGVQEGNGKVIVSWKASPAISVPHSTAVRVGQNLTASISLSNGYNPTGTVTFKVFGPADASCSSPLATLSASVSGAAATSAAYVPTAVGTYRWTASYAGDDNNTAAGPTACGATGSTVEVTAAVPSITTSPSVSQPITGTSFSDYATLAGGYQATGAITFALYDNDTCSGDPVVRAGPVTVNGNGAYDSGSVVAPAPGTYYWVATYGGDARNESAVSGCASDKIMVQPHRTPAFIFSISWLSKTYGDPPFSVSQYVSTESTGAVTFALGAGSVGCSVTAAGMVTITSPATGASKCILEASVAADADFSAAGPFSSSFNIAQATPAFINVITGSATWDGQPHAASADVSGVGGEDLGPASVSYELRTGYGPDYSYGTPTTVAPTAVGVYRITFGYAGSADYASVSDNTRLLVIGKAAQSITFDPLPDRTYGDPDFTVSATADSGLPVVFAVSGNCGLSGTSVHLQGAGSCTVLAAQPGDGNYNPARSVSQTFTIAKASQTITFPVQPSRTYGYPDFWVGATASSGLAVGYIAAGQCSMNGIAVHLAGAGSCTVTVWQPGNMNYDAAPSVSRTFTIDKAPLSVTADADRGTAITDHFTRPYGSANPAFTARIDGLVNGDDVTDLLGTLSFVTDAVTTSPVGAYAVTPSGLESPNYDISFIAGTLDIGKADQSITFGPLSDRTYGDPDFTVSATASSGLPVVFAVSGDCGLSGTTVHLMGAGSCTVLAAQGGDTDWNPARSVSQTFTIAKADATISMTGYSGTYDGASHTATGTVTGVKGEALNGLDLTATVHRDAGSYSDAWTFTDTTGDYNSTTGTVNDSVAKALLRITPDAGQKMTYGDTPATNLGYTLSGFVNSETDSGLRAAGALSGQASCSAGIDKTTAAGTYPISCTTGSLAATNYAFAPATGTVTFAITKATLTVTTDNKSVQYSDPLPGLSYTIAGFVNGETLATSGVTGTPSLGATATLGNGNVTSGPGTYSTTAARGSLSATNYDFTFVGGSLTVSREDARATYTGNALFWSGSTSSSSATVTLAATIRDVSAISGDAAWDANPGTITRASVTFVNRDTNTNLCTASVALVSSADPTVGTATCTTSLGIGSSGASQYTIGTLVSGWYTDDSATENTVIDVAQPIGSYFITGGGFLVESASGGAYAAAPGTKSNFGFNVKFNKGATNLQGNVNVIFRNGGHTYQIKSTALTSLAGTPSPCSKATSTSPCKANFASKANLQDITNPNAPISLGGNLTFQMAMTDYGDATKDTIAVTLYNGSSLLFSSDWSGTKTIEQTLGGGSIAVR